MIIFIIENENAEQTLRLNNACDLQVTYELILSSKYVNYNISRYFSCCDLLQVQREILQDVDQRIDKEKQRWEDNFRREADTRVRTAEENIRSDFRNGLEDAQRQCADIIKTTQDRTTNMENSLTEKIEVLDHTNATRVQDCENNLVRLIDNTMKERDVKLAQNFKLETDRMRQEIVDIRGDLNQLSSKCCTIL